MEIGQEGVDDLKFVGRIDEDIGVSVASGDWRIAAEVLKDAASRRAYDEKGLAKYEEGEWTAQLVTLVGAGAACGAICGYGMQ